MQCGKCGSEEGLEPRVTTDGKCNMVICTACNGWGEMLPQVAYAEAQHAPLWAR